MVARHTTKMTGKTLDDIKRKAKKNSPNWRIVRTKKLYVTYNVTMERLPFSQIVGRRRKK